MADIPLDESPRSEADGFGERLLAALGQSGLSRAELARRLRVTPAAVSHWLRGIRTPPDDVLRSIAKVTRVEHAWLAGEQPEAVLGAVSPDPATKALPRTDELE